MSARAAGLRFPPARGSAVVRSSGRRRRDDRAAAAAGRVDAGTRDVRRRDAPGPIRAGVRRDVARLRAELFRLSAERDDLIGGLGAAVYDGDDEARERLSEQIGELDERAHEKEAEMQAIVQEAQERLERGGRRVEPTLIEPPQPVPVPEPTPPPDEGTPPQPAPVPEPSPPPDEATPPQPPRIPEPGPPQGRH